MLKVSIMCYIVSPILGSFLGEAFSSNFVKNSVMKVPVYWLQPLRIHVYSCMEFQKPPNVGTEVIGYSSTLCICALRKYCCINMLHANSHSRKVYYNSRITLIF